MLKHSEKIKLARKIAPRKMTKGQGIFRTRGWVHRRADILLRETKRAITNTIHN